MIDPLLLDGPDTVVCHHCESGQVAEPYGMSMFIESHVQVAGIACASCIMAFERDDAPEELAITLGDELAWDDNMPSCPWGGP